MDYHEEREQSWIRPEWLSLVRHWERGLLLLLVMAILAMVVTLLCPRPQAVIALQPYASGLPQVKAGLETVPVGNDKGQSEEAATGDEAAIMVQDEDQSSNANLKLQKRPKRGVYPYYHKKPAHPPVTNLNTAKAQQLQLLPGVGPKMAERILEYRKANGGFKTVEQVMDVKGIGPKKFEKMKAFLKV